MLHRNNEHARRFAGVNRGISAGVVYSPRCDKTVAYLPRSPRRLGLAVISVEPPGVRNRPIADIRASAHRLPMAGNLRALKGQMPLEKGGVMFVGRRTGL